LYYVESVFFDTAPIIYYIEGNDAYGPLMKQLWQYLSKKKISIYTSVLTIAEVLPRPWSQNQSILIEKFLTFLKEKSGIYLLEITSDIAELAGRLRGKYNSLKTIDAIQIAATIHSSTDMIITNDIKLKQISEVNVLVLKDYI